MKALVLVFTLGLSLVATSNFYRVTDNFSCGHNGWICNVQNGRNEIIYDCLRSSYQEIWIWIWSDSLPLQTFVLTLQNCRDIEVRVNMNSKRSPRMLQLNIFNVSYLKIYKDENHYYESRVMHTGFLPFSVVLDNVEQLEMDPNIMNEQNSECPGDGQMINLRLINVRLNNAMKQLFNNRKLNQLLLKNVVIEGKSISVITNYTTIQGSTFPTLSDGSIQITAAEKAIFFNNTFKTITKNFINVRSSSFKFSENYVEEVNPQGFNVIGSKIEISSNNFNHIDTRAFESISLAYIFPTYYFAKATFNFSRNSIKNMDPGALHPSWATIKINCVDIVFANNEFDCSCQNLGWMNLLQGLGPKIQKNAEFYNLYVNTTSNRCRQIRECSVKKVITLIHDICHNNTNLTTVCSQKTNEIVNKTIAPQTTTSSSLPTSTLLSSATPIKEKTKTTASDMKKMVNDAINEDTDYMERKAEVAPLNFYSENQNSNNNHSSTPIWLALGLLILTSLFITYLVMLWWNRNKKKEVITTMYKSHKENDADNLIVINERSNKLFQEINEIE